MYVYRGFSSPSETSDEIKIVCKTCGDTKEIPKDPPCMFPYCERCGERMELDERKTS